MSSHMNAKRSWPGVPFVVGLNRFDGTGSHDVAEVREALAVPDEVPVIQLDARDRESAKSALLALLTMLRTRLRRRTLRRSELGGRGETTLTLAGPREPARAAGPVPSARLDDPERKV